MIYIASDHAGFNLKEKVKVYLARKKVKFEDLSPLFNEGDDYPDIAKPAAEKVVKDKALGIFVCGSGTGMCVAANKVKGARACPCTTVAMANRAKKEDFINILCLGARLLSFEKTKPIINAFLSAKYSTAKRHVRRVKKV